MKKIILNNIFWVLFLAGTTFSSCSNSSKVDDEFNNSKFSTRNIETSNGRSTYMSIYFTNRDKFINSVQIVKRTQFEKGKDFHYSDETNGSWKWSDSVNRIIEIQLENGKTFSDYSGKWQISDNFNNLEKISKGGYYTTFFKDEKSQ